MLRQGKIVQQFINLLINENIKLIKRKTIWVMLSIIVSITIISLAATIHTTSKTSDNWKADLKSEIVESEKTYTTLKSELGKPVLEKNIKIMKYQISHNIPPLNDNSMLGFTESTLDFSIIITLFIIIIASSIVSIEYKWGTLKFLFLRPVEKWKILTSKFLIVILYGFFMLFFLTIISMLFGAFAFGIHDLPSQYVLMKNNTIYTVPMITHFLQLLGAKIVNIIMISAIAIMISTLTKNNTLAIVLSIVIEISGSLISSILATFFNQGITKYFFFTNTDLYQYVEDTPKIEGMTIEFSIIVLLIYFIFFISISLFSFYKRLPIK